MKRRRAEQARRASIQAGLRAQRERARREREAQRQAAANERERKRLYIEDCKAKATELTAAVQDQLDQLESVLADGLASRSELSFEQMKRDFEVPLLDPAGLDQPVEPPRWEEVAPSPPRLIGRLTGGGAQYKQELLAAREQYDRRVAQHRAIEENRQQELQRRRRAHAQQVAADRQAYNAKIDQFERDVRAGEHEAVEAFFKDVVDSSLYPDGFLHLTRAIYVPQPRELVIEYELPPQPIIPTEREYRYVQTRDEIDAIARPVKEIKECYARLIAQVALRTIHEVFTADSFNIIDSVTFTGLVSTVDKATGQPIRPPLLSVNVSREQFDGLVLADVEPIACLKHLNALVSPHPYDLEPVSPLVDFEALLAQYKFVEGMDVIAGLDSRQDLLALTPTEFEHFTRQLFEEMGMKAWNTVASKDDGVDAVATSEVPLFGGLCIIQAKRYSGPVGVEHVRALAGTMEQKHATKGVMGTTSWVTREGWAFAKEHARIEIFEGGHLKELAKKHRNMDVLISLPKPPPRRRQPSS